MSLGGLFTTKLRTLVSQDRARHHDEEMGVNIDLTYITDRVLAMSFPATGIEAAWRNDIQDVCRLLQTKHKNNFLVFNLSERDYKYDLLDNQIVCFPFKDHHAPPLHIIFQIIFNIDSWLKANPQHVAIVHCIGGKGRTGLIVVCYLFFCGLYSEVDKCLEHFAHARSAKGKGVTQPSQLRYVRYFCGIVSNKLQMSLNPLILTKVSVGPVPKGYYVFVEFYPQIYDEKHNADSDELGQPGDLLFSTFSPPESRTIGDDQRYTTECDVELSGDILVRGYIVGLKETKGKTRMFRMQFHTGLVHRGEIAIPKGQLDDLNKEKKKFLDFELRLTFDSSDCPRNSMAVYNMIFSQMKSIFSEQQKRIAEDPNYVIRQNTLKLTNDSPNNSSNNFTTIINEINNTNNTPTNNNTTSNSTPSINPSQTNTNDNENNQNTTTTTTITTNFPTTKKTKPFKQQYNTMRETKSEKAGKGYVGTYRIPTKEDDQKIAALLEDKLESITNPKDPPTPSRLHSPTSPNPPTSYIPPPTYSFIPAVPTTHTSSYAAATSIINSSPTPSLTSSSPSIPTSAPAYHSTPLSISTPSLPTYPLSTTPTLPSPSVPLSSSTPAPPQFATLVSLLSRSASYSNAAPPRTGVVLASPRDSVRMQIMRLEQRNPPAPTHANATATANTHTQPNTNTNTNAQGHSGEENDPQDAQNGWKDSTPSSWDGEAIARNTWRASSPHMHRRGTIAGGASPIVNHAAQGSPRPSTANPASNGSPRTSVRSVSLDSVLDSDTTSSLGSSTDSTQESLGLQGRAKLDRSQDKT